MCTDPTCSNKAEVKQCEILAEAFANTVPVNGRCAYHEDLSTGLANLKGKVNIMLLIQASLLGLLVGHLFFGKGL